MKQEVKFQAPESSHLHESPLRRRYGSDEMKKIWDPQNLWLKVRDVWVANARAQKGAGLVRPAELRDLIKHRSEIDIDDIERREMDRTYRDEVTGESKYTGHDVIAAIAEFGERATVGSRIIHQGMTSEDALSNAEMGLIHESFDLLERRIVDVLARFAGHIDNYKDMVCMGYTHLQAAEPTTVGYRMARYAQDFLNDLHLIQTVTPLLKTKGMKGTVGTSASYSALLEGTGLTVEDFEKQVMEELGLEAVLISAQTYPRKFTYLAMTMLASVGQSAHQFATDTKILQFSDVNQAAEARDKEDLGSSYMPWKKNPRHSESTKSLTRGLPGKVSEAWHSASEGTLERGLEDSAGKREYLSSAFIIADEALLRVGKILDGFKVKEGPIKKSLDHYLPFFTLGGLMMELQRRGADRTAVHALFAKHALTAQDAIDFTGQNPLIELVCTETKLHNLMTEEELRDYFGTFEPNVGNAPSQCTRFLKQELLPAIQQYNK